MMGMRSSKAANRTEPAKTAEAPLLDSLAAAIEKLFVLGRERGYVTYDDLNKALPIGPVSPKQIWDTKAMLLDEGIDIIEAFVVDDKNEIAFCESNTTVDLASTPRDASNIVNNAPARLEAVATDFEIPVDVARGALKQAAADYARAMTTRATEAPRPDKTAPGAAPSPKVQAVFGDIPAEFQTKRHSKTVIPEDTIHDPDVVQTAKDIVNANRRTKIETLAPKAQETLRIARRIVWANKGHTLA